MLRRKAEDERIYLSHKTNDPVLIHINNILHSPEYSPTLLFKKVNQKYAINDEVSGTKISFL